MGYLTNAIRLATLAHAEQVDKAGQPYVFHVLRVMLSPTLTTEAERIVAVLHDLKEDQIHLWPSVERDYGWSEEIMAGLDGVTWRPEESWRSYLNRAKANPISLKVKLADLHDNLRPMPNPTKKDENRSDKYRRAIKILTGEWPIGY